MKQLPIVASFVLFIAVCVSIAFWAMQLFKPPVRPVAPPQTAKQEISLDAAAALFGGRQAAMAVASNFQLKGVIMSGSPGESIAILSADGKPATATRVSQEVMPGVTVKEVHPHYVLLVEHGVSKRVDLPESARGQSGMLTVAPTQGSQGAAPEPMPSEPSAEPITEPAASDSGTGTMPGPAAASAFGTPPTAPGMNPLPGYAGAPPVMQSSPENQPPAMAPHNGVIHIPAPAAR